MPDLKGADLTNFHAAHEGEQLDNLGFQIKIPRLHSEYLGV